MAKAKYTLDIQDVITAANQYAAKLTGMQGATYDLIVAQEQYNRKGKLVAATVDVQIDAHRRLTVEIEKNAKAQVQAIGKITEARAKLEQRPRQTVGGLASATASEAQLRQLFPAPPVTAIGAIARYENAMSRIFNLIAAGKIEAAKVNEIFAAIASGKSLSGLNNIEQRVASQVAALRGPQVKQPKPVNLQAGAQVEATLKAKFPAPGNAEISQLAKYENALARISNLVSSGRVSGARVQELLSGLGSGKGFSNLTADEQKVVAALGQISRGFKTAEKDAQSFHLTIRNAFRIAEALLFKDALSFVIDKLKESTFEAAKFQIKISQIRTISQDNQASFNSWGDSIRRVSDEFGLNNLDVAEAAYQAISNQVTNGREETEAFLRSTADFARVGVATIADATEATSSVINSYGLTLNRVGQLQAQFFKAVELGRFKVSDTTNIGRVSAPAATIGVKVPELLAGLSTLTRQGVSPADAQTQLLNLFNSLAKPTEKLTQLFKQYGVESAQAGIATFGFEGFLSKLEETAKGDIAVISELGGDLRAIRALIGLTTRGFGDQFRKDKKEIENAGVSFQKAIDIRGESSADELIKEFTKIKNFFIIDLGQKSLGALATFNKEYISLLDLTKLFGKGIVAGIAILGVYKVTVATVSLAQAAYTAVVTANTAAAFANAGAQGFLARTSLATGAILNAIPYVKVIGLTLAATTAIVSLYEQGRDKSEAFREETERLLALQPGQTTAKSKKPVEVFTEDANKKQDQLSNAIDRAFEQRLQNLAQQNVANNEVLDNLKSKGNETAQALKASFGAISDAINSAIDAYKQRIGDAKRGIEELNRSIKGTSQTAESIIFELKNQFASEVQKVSLRQGQIDALLAKAKQVAEAGGEGAEQELARIKSELAGLVRDQVAGQAQLGIQRARALREQGIRDGTVNPANANAPIQVDIESQRGKIEGTLNAIAAEELKLVAIREKQKKNNEENLVKKKEELRIQEDIAKEVLKATPLNDKGDGVKKDFLTPEGKFNANAFDKARSDAIDRFLNTIKPPIDGTREQLDEFSKTVAGFREVLAKESLILKAQAEALVKNDQIKSQQKDAGLEREKLKKEGELLSNARINARKNLQQAAERISANLEITPDFVDAAQSRDTFGKRVKAGAIQQRAAFGNQVGQGDAVAGIGGIGLLGAAAIQGLFKTDQQKISEKNKLNLGQIEAFNQTIKQLVEGTVDKDGNIKATAGKDIEQATNLFRRMNTLVDQVASEFTGNVSARGITDARGVSLGERRDAIAQQLELLQRSINEDQAAQQRLDNIGQQINSSVTIEQQQLNALQVLIGVVANGNQQLINTVIANLRQNPLNIRKFHTGGLITGPHGNDNLLIRAESGEMIMNRKATADFFPQLVQMNGGAFPSTKGSFHSGGLVNSTTVGDVNVTINGPVDPKQNIRDIGKGLQRAIRQGQLNLGSKGNKR